MRLCRAMTLPCPGKLGALIAARRFGSKVAAELDARASFVVTGK
jgi:hypothetical protein